jgi:DNA polymerase-3 subunit gamma/tau
VHQLSSFAFNALLKTLEEPPEHAVFVLATTEISKVPATIVSRCQRYDFRRVALTSITQLLKNILDAEGIAYTDEALYAIARAADGGIRDAESILEQVISYADKNVTYQDVFDVLGLVDWKVLHELCDAILAQDVATLLRIVERIVAEGKDLSQFVQDILQYFRNLLVCKTADPRGLLALPDEEIETMKSVAGRFTLTGLIRHVERFAELSKDFDSQLAQRIALESLLIRISKVSVEMSVDTVLEKIVQLGAGGVGGGGSERPFVRGAAKPAEANAAAPVEMPEEETPRATRVSLTEDNLPALWPRITHVIAERDLNLGVALGHATPVGIDGDTLVLRFHARQGRSQGLVERGENSRAVAAVLREITHNVSSFRCETAEGGEPSSEQAGRGHMSAGHIHPDEAKAALADPHVAKVVELFRGRIVDIKHGAATAETT